MISDKKKISVIIPCYNVEKYIHRCVNSLLNQKIGIKNLQLIFIDDASTDGTLDILYDYKRKYSEDIVVIPCEKNGKQGTARNIGFKYAEADYIGFVDSDDWIHEDMYLKLYEKAVEFDCDMVSCNYTGADDEGFEPKECSGENTLILLNSADDRKRLLASEKCPGGVWTKIYKRNIILDNNIFFPERITYEDNYWGSVMMFLIKRLYVIDEILYYYYFNMNSTVRLKNSGHHFDRLKIELMKIDYFRRNGLFELYKDEIEYSFIKLFYVNSMNIFLTRFDEIPYDVIDKMNKILFDLFPDYKNNKHLDKLNIAEKTFLEVAKLKIY